MAAKNVSKTGRSAARSGRGALGRGLGNLLDTDLDQDEAVSPDGQTGIVEIDITKIRANPDNPRKNFDQSSIEELAQTIEKFGLLQPILVRKIDDSQYVVVSGERRLRACRLLKKNEVPCIIKNLDEQENIEVSLIENIQREQLDPIEEAMVYDALMRDYNMTQEVLSGKVGKNRATIANRVRLLKLPVSVQTAVADGRLTEGQVRPILGLKNEKLQQRLASEILRNQYSARQVEELVKKYGGKPAKAAPKKASAESGESNAVARELSEILQTRVQVKHSGKTGKGSIVIEYFSLDNLDSLLQFFRK